MLGSHRDKKRNRAQIKEALKPLESPVFQNKQWVYQSNGMVWKFSSTFYEFDGTPVTINFEFLIDWWNHVVKISNDNKIRTHFYGGGLLATIFRFADKDFNGKLDDIDFWEEFIKDLQHNRPGLKILHPDLPEIFALSRQAVVQLTKVARKDIGFAITEADNEMARILKAKTLKSRRWRKH